ncbi:ATP-binding protein [Streptomyces sp. NPDC059506]|uniref:ATP-binding protein n=1 Tax=Streptomyces sp. NPDC059506 TaxID=3347751 RepID=UPI0036D0B163
MSYSLITVAVVLVLAVLLVLLTRMARTVALLRHQLRTAHRQADLLKQDAARMQKETEHLAVERLPALVDTLVVRYPGVVVPGLADEALHGTAFEEHHNRVLELCAEAVERTRRDIGDTALATVRDLTSLPQSHLVLAQQKILEQMDRSADTQQLMELDHLLTLAQRQVQRLRILSGAWPGIQRDTCTLGEIVESARGRTEDYARVTYVYLSNTGQAWVVGSVAEPLAVALAELLDNALSYSQGMVTVTVEAVQAGYCIQVDDRGVGMNPSARAAAAHVLKRQEALDITTIAQPPRLGLTLVARLCGEYGFQADVQTPSAYGGVRAVLLVPHELITDAPAAPAKTDAPEPTRAASLAHTSAVTGPAGASAPALPKRRRRAPASTMPRPVEAAASTPAVPETLGRGIAAIGRALSPQSRTSPEGPSDDPHAS